MLESSRDNDLSGRDVGGGEVLVLHRPANHVVAIRCILRAVE
jgi:hypothetical protein